MASRDIALSVCATLLLEENTNPIALILVGGPSSSKTTVADLFADHKVAYVSDNFTPASFVSHAANVTSKNLEKVDLLPRIKHKLLVTPELAPIFRGKDDELASRFSTITRVLDGHGLMTDSGEPTVSGATEETIYSPGLVAQPRSNRRYGGSWPS
jgi:hypothetical protein